MDNESVNMRFIQRWFASMKAAAEARAIARQKELDERNAQWESRQEEKRKAEEKHREFLYGLTPKERADYEVAMAKISLEERQWQRKTQRVSPFPFTD